MTADTPTGRISAGTLEFPQSHGYALGGTRGPSRDTLCTRHTHTHTGLSDTQLRRVAKKENKKGRGESKGESNFILMGVC